MSLSPSKSAVHLAPNNAPTTLPPPSPRAHRSIRRLQSAQSLSSTPPTSNTPSLPSHQRQQQQRTVSGIHKDPPAQHPPPVPALPSNTRSRANSDAALTSVSQAAPPPRRNLAAKKVLAPVVAAKGAGLDTLLREGPVGGDVTGALREMSQLAVHLTLLDDVLTGLSKSPLRIYIWLILLCAPSLSTDSYLALIHRGPSPAYAKIRNDTFRTLATDPLFRRRVSEASLIRLLNAVAWRLHDAKEERLSQSRSSLTNMANPDGSPELQIVSPVGASAKHAKGPQTATTEGSEAGGAEPGTYVQGMNVLAAPFLYAARSESEAFVAFHQFLTTECPGYVRGAMDGVHQGLALVDKVLAIVDSKLSGYLTSKGMHAELYAFPSVLTLCACTPPLPEVLHLWDFLFSYGAHLNIFCIVAQLVIIRDTILSSPSPTKILRSFPPLQAKQVIGVACSLVPKVSNDVYMDIVMHAK
ncbi:MAG: hypothetical protein M1812_002939 [Candelaria pacifica]|nr:MAG: hypothetical protein M1812_002939 [Candelaria pacifica]